LFFAFFAPYPYPSKPDENNSKVLSFANIVKYNAMKDVSQHVPGGIPPSIVFNHLMARSLS
jgi:hypothetical protein